MLEKQVKENQKNKLHQHISVLHNATKTTNFVVL
jgi:hypothetical protein